MAAAVALPARALDRAMFGLAGETLAFDAADESVRRILESTYAGARAPRSRSFTHSASVRRLGDGRLDVRFDRRALPPAQAGQSAPLVSAYYVVKEVFARFAASLEGSIAFYGALVAVGGAGVLLLGPSTIGKTVLALHLAARGAVLLGDETAVVDARGGIVSALPRSPALRESALRWLPSAEMRACVEGAEHVVATERGRFWYALGAKDLCGIAPSEQPCRLRAVCFVRERGERSDVRRIDLERALPALMQRAYGRPSQLGEFSRMRRAMRHAALFDLTLGEPRESAQKLLDEVRACA